MKQLSVLPILSWRLMRGVGLCCFVSLGLGSSACRPLRTQTPGAQLQEKKGKNSTQNGHSEKDVDEALRQAGGSVKEAEEANKLFKERKELEAETKKLQEALAQKKAELLKPGLAAKEKKELEVAIATDEKSLKTTEAKFAANATALKKALEKVLAADSLPESVRDLLKELLARISELSNKGEGELESGSEDESGSEGESEASKPTPVGSGGQSPSNNGTTGDVRLVLETNNSQCLSLASPLPSLGSCQGDSSLAPLGTADVELRPAQGDRCLSVRSTSSEPFVEKCNGALVQKWNVRFRTSGGAFRLENAVVTGAAGEALCLRGDAGRVILDRCTNAATYFLKKTP